MSLIRRGKFTDHFETVRLTKENKLIEVSIMVSPVKDVEGNIIGASKVARDITQSKRYQERIEHLAHHDSLTDLPNRALLEDRMKIALANAARNGCHLAVLFLDLDRFKVINDSLGHEIGDRLLKNVADRICPGIRLTDTLSRIGGDEFIIVLSQIETAENAVEVGSKLLRSISKPYQIDGRELLLTASIGVSIYPLQGENAGRLLRNADAAMYAAKKAGRNQCKLYSEDMTSRTAERFILEHDLHGAHKRNEIFIMYQPQIDLSSGEVMGAEALMRWRHPLRGLISPVEFIPIAEDSGLILDLGEHVLLNSCLNARRWFDLYGIDINIAVNVSAVQFRQEIFKESVLNTLAHTGLAPSRLELELTESVLMQELESVARRIRVLASHGVKMAIDDFGTGYSSLAYLRELPVNRLKIDQSFIKSLPGNSDAQAIVCAIVAMGHGLGLRVIAEGVETEAQATFLQGIGCNETQGYFYAKPMEASDFEVWLTTRKTACVKSS